jgi:hypothetical protein
MEVFNPSLLLIGGTYRKRRDPPLCATKQTLAKSGGKSDNEASSPITELNNQRK